MLNSLQNWCSNLQTIRCDCCWKIIVISQMSPINFTQTEYCTIKRTYTLTNLQKSFVEEMEPPDWELSANETNGLYRNLQIQNWPVFHPIMYMHDRRWNCRQFLTTWPFYENLRDIWQPKPIKQRRLEPPKKLEELLESCKWENWKSTLCFVELSRRLDKTR